MKEELDRLLRYDVWANRETLASLEQDPVPPRSHKWMAHIVGAEHLWLARLRRQSPSFAVWPELTIAQCAERLSDLADSWQAYLDLTPASRMTDQIPYTNSKGESWSNTVEEILTHVTIHSAYHRGQIASDLRAAGHVPAYTDYIHAVRQGFLT
ncbi:MAG: DinB family protein [Gemmatimonadales bacterium]